MSTLKDALMARVEGLPVAEEELEAARARLKRALAERDAKRKVAKQTVAEAGRAVRVAKRRVVDAKRAKIRLALEFPNE